MGYNPFKWYTKGKKNRLPQSAHLFDKIQNGDFDYSSYYTEAEAARQEYASLFQKTMDETGDYSMARTAAKMKNVRALKLDEEALLDEQRLQRDLRNELKDKFGFCLWDNMMDESPMDLEQLYDYYCHEEMRRKGLDV